MKNKKIVTMAASLSLCAVVGIGATLAYFTDKTSTVTNTFTIGNVDITLTEPDWNPDNSKNLYPGAEISKNPMITNTGEGDAYVAIKVDGMAEMTDVGFSADVDTENWVKVDADGVVDSSWTEGTLADGYYAYMGTLAAGKNTPALFDKVVYAAETEGRDVDVIGYFTDGTNLYTQAEVEQGTEDQTAVEIQGNLQKNDDGSYVLKYVIGEDRNTTYDSYDAAEEAIRENDIASSIAFDLDITGYAVQTEGITFQTGNTYDFITEFGFGGNSIN